jgi:hypothetical protein
MLPSKIAMGSQNHDMNGMATPTNPTTILVFGPQCLSFNHQAASHLRSQLLGNSDLHWMVDAMQSLRDYWNDLLSAIPMLQHLDGEQSLQRLAAWLQSEQAGMTVWPLPNIILTPLVVVLHLVEFYQSTTRSSQDQEDKTLANVLGGVSEVLGLCTGLLSSATVSCSKVRKHLPENGAIAIRLAMLIGAVVDAKDSSLPELERARSLSVSWSQPGGYSSLESIIDTIPQVSQTFRSLCFPLIIRPVSLIPV